MEKKISNYLLKNHFHLLFQMQKHMEFLYRGKFRGVPNIALSWGMNQI